MSSYQKCRTTIPWMIDFDDARTEFSYCKSSIPACKQHQNDVVSTSMRRDHVASTLIRRHFHVVCPLGYFSVSIQSTINSIAVSLDVVIEWYKILSSFRWNDPPPPPPPPPTSVSLDASLHKEHLVFGIWTVSEIYSLLRNKECGACTPPPP